MASGVAQQRGVSHALPAATAPFASVSHSGAAGVSTAGSGSLLAVPPGYEHSFNVYRYLQGGLAPGQIVLDQQLAATLQAQIGDTVTITPRPGARPQRFRVSGVALITAPDTVFQPLNPQLGPAPAQPPSNAAILPLARSPARSHRSYPPSRPAAIGSSAVPGAQSGVAVAGPRAGRPGRARPHARTGLHALAADDQLGRSARCPGRCSSSTTCPTR